VRRRRRWEECMVVLSQRQLCVVLFLQEIIEAERNASAATRIEWDFE